MYNWLTRVLFAHTDTHTPCFMIVGGECEALHTSFHCLSAHSPCSDVRNLPLSLCISALDKTDVSEAVCPPYQQLHSEDLPVYLVLELPHSPLSVLTLAFFSLSFGSVSPQGPALGFYTDMCAHIKENSTHKHSNRLSFVCLTWGELPHWKQQHWHWMGLIITLTSICPSGWSACIRGSVNTS